MAVAMPLRFPLLDQAKLTIAELLTTSVFRWPAENCLCWTAAAFFPR